MNRAIFFLSVLLLLASGCSNDGNNHRDTDTGSDSTATVDTSRIAELRSRAASLHKQISRIEDSNAIKDLQRAFGYYFDEALWDELLDLFADDAELEYARDGVYQGKERIREYFLALGKGRDGLAHGELNEHFQLMPVITVADDGQRAQGRWRDLILKGRYGEYAWWGEGPFENEYIKEDGVWKVARLHWFQTVMVPYEGGWAVHEDVNGGNWVSDELTPDAAMTIPYEPWPNTFLPPFHFENPVLSADNSGEEQ